MRQNICFLSCCSLSHMHEVTKRDSSRLLEQLKRDKIKPKVLWSAGGVFWESVQPPGLMCCAVLVQLIGEEEDVSVYDIADHPDFRFRTTDIVIRIGNSDGAAAREDEVGPGHRAVTALSPALGGHTGKSQ